MSKGKTINGNPPPQPQLRLEDILGLSEPWCLKDVISKLVEASEILLHQKNYDGHGWEEISHCVERGKEIIIMLSGDKQQQ